MATAATDALARAAEALASRYAGRDLLAIANDPQRHTDSRTVLRALTATGAFGRLRVLVACGTHRFDSPTRQTWQREMLAGLDVADIAWHDANAGDLVRIGPNWRGHRWLLDADPSDEVLLSIGSVEPHYFAGFTGAHKTCTIGVAAHDDIEANHRHALQPTCAPGVLDGNPIFESLRGWVSDLESHRPIEAIQLVQAGEAILDLFAGGCEDSLRAAAELASRQFIRAIPTPVDALVLEVTGPLAVSFYQSDKAIKNNQDAVRDGGVILLRAACPDGIGQDHFVSLLRRADTWADATNIVRHDGYRLGDHKAVRLRHLTDPAGRNVRVFVESPGLTETDAAVLGFEKVADETDAWSRAGIAPASDAILRVPDAGNTVFRPQ